MCEILKHCLLDAKQVLPIIVCGITLTYLIGCAKRKNIEIESRLLPKISGFIAIKVG